MTCPTCGTPLDGIATYCWVCSEYVEDMASTRPPHRHMGSVSLSHDPRSEEEIRLTIRLALKLHGFVVVDFEQGYRRDGSTRVRKGLADLYIMGHGVGVWREIKSATGKPTPEQLEFGEDCRRCGIDWGIWRHESEAIAWAKDVKRRVA